MDISREQTDTYVRDLMKIRNERIVPLNSEGDTFGGLIADAMNGLELVYIVYRGLIEENTPQGDEATDPRYDPTVNRKEW